MKNILCFETIKIDNNEPLNLAYHQKRFEETQKKLFNLQKHPLLSSLIHPPSNSTFRCKIIYGKSICQIQYIPYTMTLPTAFVLVNSDINYDYKYTNRDEINKLKDLHPNKEIIIVKNDLITDTSIANIALYIGQKWLTPQTPLLKGTLRAKLLEEGKIETAKLTRDDIFNCDSFALMNAMVGFAIVKNFSFEG